MNTIPWQAYIKRFVLVAVISLGLVVSINEISFLMQKEPYDRAPQTVQIVIPPGTAELVEQGKESVTPPEDMVFVIGDVLEVVNQDDVGHQLGPIWVPPHSVGRLALERAERYAFSCSFQTSRYLNLDVRQATTLSTRLIALGLSFPTMATLIFIYSLLAFPIPSVARLPEEGALR